MRKSISTFTLGSFLAILPVTGALASEPDASVTAKAPPPSSVAAPVESASPFDVTSPEAAEAMARHYRDEAQRYRAMGGFTYKAGLVQRAEADAAKYAALAAELRGPVSVALPRSPEAERYAQLAAQYRRFGGVAYKAGLVQWAEAQQRKYEPAVPADAVAMQQPNQSCRSTKPVVCFQLGVR